MTLHPLMNYHPICNASNTTDATSGARIVYPPGTPETTANFY